MKMGDDMKKKKADGKRIALGQKHEVAYLKKIAKEMLNKLQADKKNKDGGEPGIVYLTKEISIATYPLRTDKLIRICKALIKVLK